MEGTLTPLQRLWLAFVAFYYVLANRCFAEEVHRRRRHQRGALSEREHSHEDDPSTPDRSSLSPLSSSLPHHEGSALQVLSLLQRDGRLIDFVSENLDGFSDAEVGAAARAVHAGCRKMLDTYLKLEPVYAAPEGTRITLTEGFDPASVHLTGNVIGSPPFNGSLRHHGWRATQTSFPTPSPHDPYLLAPAEVEL